MLSRKKQILLKKASVVSSINPSAAQQQQQASSAQLQNNPQQQALSKTKNFSSGDDDKSILVNEKKAVLKQIKNEAEKLKKETKELDTLFSTIGSVVAKENNLEKEKELKKLCHALTDWESINDKSLIGLIGELRKNVTHLDDKMNPVIQQILSGNWVSRSEKIIRQIESFLSELLILRPTHVGTTIHSLIQKFIVPPIINPLEQKEDEVSLKEERIFSIIHRNLQKILVTFPMRQESVVKTFSTLYPYIGRPTHVHYCYLKNMIFSLDYLTDVKSHMIKVILHKMVRIDISILKKDLEELSEDLASNSFSLKSESGGLSDVFSMESEEFVSNPLIKTLDSCLSLLFESFTSVFSSESGEELFPTLLNSFGSEILPLFGLNNVQFLIFYATSLQPGYTPLLLDFLWEKAVNVNNAPVIRVQTMSFLSGILARAKYINIKTVKRWLTKMSEWANAYVSQKTKASTWSFVDLQAHGPFYAVCQTIFYVFAFRNKELITSKRASSFTRTLNLGRLVTSDLNPLKACENQIAVFFVSAAHQHQISYCSTVLERNTRATIPTIARSSLANLESDAFGACQLETFFPFDPFLLPICRKWIDPMYKLYEAYYEEFKIDKKEEGYTEETEDSIEMELGSYKESQTISFYCNGATPFKFKTDIKDEIDSFID